MAVVPTNNLPPESQPWARDRDAAIEQLQFDVKKNAESNSNAFIAVNNSLSAIAKQVADIAQVANAAAAAAAAASVAAASAGAAAATANAAVADLAGRITAGATGTGFNTGTLPNTGVTTWYTAQQASLTLNVPTGKILISVFCGEASLSGGGSGMGACLSYAVPTAGIAVGGPEGRNYVAGSSIGTPLLITDIINVTPGFHTVEGVPGAYSFSTGSSANFQPVVLTVQVVV